MSRGKLSSEICDHKFKVRPYSIVLQLYPVTATPFQGRIGGVLFLPFDYEWKKWSQGVKSVREKIIMMDHVI